MTLIAEGPVLLELDDDGVGHLVLNRPEASNGMDIAFLQALHGALMAAHAAPGLRALLVTGAGKNFCAGGDVKAFAAQGDQLPGYLREATSWLQNCSQLLRQLGAPVVAGVHGFAAGGGGFGLVCAADLVVAAESASFLAGATRVAMVPDFGTTALLPQLVGMRAAMHIVLTNPTLSAADALELGIVNEVVPDDDLAARAHELAATVAAGAPQANAEAKRLLWSGLATPIDAQLADEARTVARLGGTADAREGLAAVIERRPPRFARQENQQ
ncbi:MAG: enoyl-CoA hydratase/isomerase family protein [Acidimicrobiales bacterium]